MTAAPGMRDLAHRLLTYEAGAAKASEPMESPILRVYEKLRQSLGEFVGVAGFQSLASRALTLARPEAPRLGAARVRSDGSLQGLGEIEPQIDMASATQRRGFSCAGRPTMATRFPVSAWTMASGVGASRASRGVVKASSRLVSDSRTWAASSGRSRSAASTSPRQA